MLYMCKRRRGGVGVAAILVACGFMLHKPFQKTLGWIGLFIC